MKKTIVTVVMILLFVFGATAKDDKRVLKVGTNNPFEEKIQKIHEADKVAVQALFAKREQLTLNLRTELTKEKPDMQVVSQLLDQLNDLKNEIWIIKKNQILEIMKIVPADQRLKYLRIELRDSTNDLLYKSHADVKNDAEKKTKKDGK